MKLELVIFETKPDPWVVSGRSDYLQKLQHFCPFSIVSLKSPSASRDQAEVKRKKESEILLKRMGDRDLLILFSEEGQAFKSSEDMSRHVKRLMESGKPRLVFCIGGPYGFDSTVKQKSAGQWSLSPLTMNHWVAQLVALEQIYRSLTLIKGIPYHNR